MPNRQRRGRTAGQILRDISIAAHEYAKSKTTVLSSLLGRPTPVADVLKSEPTPHVPGRPEDVYKTRLFRRKGTPGTVFAYSSAFEKDLARIVHSPSFRKLQGKSQLIPAGESYFFRTRLTHSIEVAEIAKRIAMKINFEGKLRPYVIDYDLVSCAALLHDIGHPPFGHSGEEVLNERMHKFGGFEGNAQTLRLVTRLENRLGHRGSVQAVYDDPRGLNLAIGTLAAIIKYDRPLVPTKGKDDRPIVTKGYYEDEALTVRDIKVRLGIESEDLSTIECQIMDIADDIAYSAYDLEDTMEAGIITPFDFISVYDETLREIKNYVNEQLKKRRYKTISQKMVLLTLTNVFATILQYADRNHPYRMNLEGERKVFVGRSHNEALLHGYNPLIRRQFLETLIEANISKITVKPNKKALFLSKLVVGPARLRIIECMKAFNFHKVISSKKLQIPHHRSRKIIETLFDALRDDKDGKLLSDTERAQLQKCKDDERRRMRLICDIIASRTDSEAIRLFNRLSGIGNGSVFDYGA